MATPHKGEHKKGETGFLSLGGLFCGASGSLPGWFPLQFPLFSALAVTGPSRTGTFPSWKETGITLEYTFTAWSSSLDLSLRTLLDTYTSRGTDSGDGLFHLPLSSSSRHYFTFSRASTGYFSVTGSRRKSR